MIEYPGIDYDFRPDAVLDVDQDSALYVVSRIKGSNRQEMVIDYIQRGKADELEPGLLRETLPREEIDALARVNATFLGGEFLPDFLTDEVELVRLVMQTPHRDTVSVRARPAGDEGILLRAVDEYGTDFPGTDEKLPERPSLRELINWLEGESGTADSLLLFPVEQALAGGSRPEDVSGFVEVRSLFYPGLPAHAYSAYAERLGDSTHAGAASEAEDEAEAADDHPAATFVTQVHERGEKRGKLRTLLGLFGYERRSEANVREISTALYARAVATVPSLLKTPEGWPIELDEWFKAYPLWGESELPEDAVVLIENIRAGNLPDDVERPIHTLLEWYNSDPDNADVAICLFLGFDALGDEERALQAGQAAIRADDERAAPWLCVGRHLMRYELSNYEALSSFYKATEFPGTLFERYHALSWIHKLQADAGATRYAKQAQRKLEELETAGVRPLPDMEAPLVEVIHPGDVELVGL